MSEDNLKIIGNRIIFEIAEKKWRGRIVRSVVKTLKERFKAKERWKNYLSFYLLWFDDYAKEYIVNGEVFILEAGGWEDFNPLCIHTDIKNEMLFREVVATIQEAIKI